MSIKFLINIYIYFTMICIIKKKVKPFSFVIFDSQATKVKATKAEQSQNIMAIIKMKLNKNKSGPGVL